MKHGEVSKQPIKYSSPEEVHCDACGCRLLKSKAQEVKDRSKLDSTFYCNLHRVPYDEFIPRGIFDLNESYYKKFEVDKDGRPFGYEKIKEESKKK